MKKIIPILSILIFLFLSITPITICNADNSIGAIEDTDTIIGSVEITDEYSPSVSEMTNLIESRLNSIIELCQKVALSFFTILFIYFAIKAIVGSEAKGGLKHGLIGMIMSAVCFVGVIKAKEIVLFLSNWLLYPK